MPEAEARAPTIVGIGASAGGLAALKTFFANVPESDGLAYVVVVHLSPEHRSHLAELLQPHVAMPVQQVTETVLLEPGRVYVIPPNANLEAVDTHLRLAELERTVRTPIDHFLRTLASTHDGKAVGVVLTGTGSDGTLGLREIRSKGGLTIVQDPAEAEFDGMPLSAIGADVVDRVLPIAEMPGMIRRYVDTAPRLSMPAEEDGALEADTRKQLGMICALIMARTGRDFTRYKPATVLRRVARRMHLAHVEELEDYIDLLRSQPNEVSTVADDLLINVTSFFRDEEFFDALAERVVAPLLHEDEPRDIRIWSVGCSTGEEPYSLAMLFLEAAAEARTAARVQIFATDLHEASLERARDGHYPADIVADVSQERLNRFFQPESSGYRVRKAVRELIVFAPHNLLSDPPFSRVDLLLCRNVLIYLQRDVQTDVAELFHYALSPDGVLGLGSAERVDLADLFRVADRKLGLYRKRAAPPLDLRLPVFPLTPSPVMGRLARAPRRLAYGPLHKEMADRYALPSLLVSPDDNVVFMTTTAGRYLDLRGGAVTQSVHALVRPELQEELRHAIHQARTRGEAQRSRPILAATSVGRERVILSVTPSSESDEADYLFVTFDGRPAPAPESAWEAGADGDGSREGAEDGQRAVGLMTERDEARHRLQAMIEEYETSREEMRASNEELQSANEELRSAMEELETSKEELQSLNEELQTVNQENRHKVEELSQLSSDLQNLLAATDIGTLFLDRQLRILRYTPRVAELFNLRSTDRGRPLSDLTHHLVEAEIVQAAQEVLRTLVPIERELQDDAGRWYMTRVLPYRSEEDRIEGVVITLVEITTRKRAEEELRRAQAELASELRTSSRLYEMTARAFKARSRREMLEEILAAAIDIHEADAGNMQLLRGDRLEIVAHTGLPQAFLEYFRQVSAEDPSACGQAIRTGTRAVIEDVTTEIESEGVRRAFAAAGLRAAQSTPLVSRRGELLGVLSTHFRQPRAFGHRDAAFAGVIAQQAADVLERMESEVALQELNATLEERVSERTREVRELAASLATAEQEERRRISQLLHEDLQQVLYGIQVMLALAHQKGRGGDTETLMAQTGKSLDLLREAVDKARRLSVDLSPPVLDGDGLIPALQWLRPQMRELHGLEVELRAPEEVEEPPLEVTILVFNIVRELLFNVRKHAGVLKATVEVKQASRCLEIGVEDGGDGFDPRTLESRSSGGGGLGLAGARQRLRFHGGDLHVRSAPGEGARVTIEIPTSR